MVVEMSDTSKELYLLFYKFSKFTLLDRSINNFSSHNMLFNVKDALKVIKEENRNVSSLYNLTITNKLPNLIHGEKTWFEFIVRKLILNGINR